MQEPFDLGDILGAALSGEGIRELFRYEGRPMEEAMTLYRSVSLPELSDIARRGVITGGGSLFNAFEGRPDVFFADEIDDRLVGHGEHIPRQVIFAMRNHPLSRRLDMIHKLIGRRGDRIIHQMRADGLRIGWALAEDLRCGMRTSKARSISFKAAPRMGPVYARLFRALRRLIRIRARLDAAWQRGWAKSVEQAEARAKTLPYSSAIIVTKPICGGRVYSATDGNCGHGEREYGFDPGQIALTDVAEVVLIKDRRQVCSVPAAGLADLCSSLGL